MRIFLQSKKKWFVGFTGVIFILSVLVSGLFPENVYAVVPVVDAPQTAAITAIDAKNNVKETTKAVKEKVDKTIMKSITAAVLSSAVQGASYFAKKIAYDTARYVAYGGKGQGALVFKDGWGAYLANTAGDAAGAAVSELGKWAGLDLCRFPNLNLQLYLELSLRQKEVPSTDCTWSDLTAAYGKDAWIKRYENAKNTADRFSSQDKLLKEFGKAIKPGNTDFGVSVGAIMTVDRIVAKKEKSAELERTTNGGFKDLQDLISGNVKTPGDVIAEETKQQLSESHQQALTYGQLGSVYASGAIEIIPQTASMFLNTLGATLIQRLFSQGIVGVGTDPGIAYDYGSDPGVLNNAENAGNAFNFLFTRTPTQPTDYNNIAEFASCPDNPGINNCVMDSGLQEALSRSTVDHPITIAEAIKPEVGLLNPNWPLISPRRLQDNQNIKGCVSEKYCYSNIQKLRKARILPLGFEIAALRSDPDHPWTLGEVVAGFDNCNRPDPNNPSFVVPDPNYPFCHLINPNWVLKAPQARCEIKAWGDALIDPASSARREECVDVSTCLGKDDTGACAQFGYCTKESNSWVIGADSCPAQFNTCSTFNNVDTRKVVSYLSKTLDYGECSADNVGCRAYSLQGTPSFNTDAVAWTNTGDADTGDMIFFNEKINSLSSVCSADNNGCSAFYGATRLPNGQYFDRNTSTQAIEFALNKDNLEHIKKAPEYLGCYDANKNLDGLQRPQTILEADTASKSTAACNNFASACVPEEVGCEAFRPSDGGAVIPGKIGDNNFCPQICVGYETFKQEPAQFDNSKFPVHFIPAQAQSCPSIASGCSEFTNIDEQGRGGEGLEYYTSLKYCEKPLANNSNIKTYYTWEGSADNGYVLRTFKMKPLTAADAQRINRNEFPAGSPAYVLDTRDALDEFTALCDEVSYKKLLENRNDPAAADSDCRALFDDGGKTYYRLLQKTVTVDEACHPLRKTDPVFVKDQDLTNAGRNACLEVSAKWNESVPGNAFCERCINGGKYENGFCVYQTISRMGESNACEPQYNGCRAYTGNAVSNIKDIFSPSVDAFEPSSQNAEAIAFALQDWTSMNPGNPTRIVPESIHTGEHSLFVPGATMRKIATSSIVAGDWYEVSFLAKSSIQNTRLGIYFLNEGALQPRGQFASLEKPLNIGNSWQYYKLGPVQFTGTTDHEVFLMFGTAGTNFYLDQVRLRRINAFEHYIKDSWKKAQGNDGNDVPLLCDSAPEDNLPGEALGCREYTDSRNVARYATGFQNLCREKAIGCEPVWDTYNTVNGAGAQQQQLFNVTCSGQANSNCRAMYQNEELGKCFIPSGATYCYIPQITLPEGVTFANVQQQNQPGQLTLGISAVSIPADTPSTTPIFLAVGEAVNGVPKYTCDPLAKGCQKVGQEERHLPNADATSFSFNDLFVKNDPESYNETLCRHNLVGCSHYQSGNKDTYFKDPEITGNSLCTYKPQTSGISSQYGWYLKGVGRCTTALTPVQVVGNQLCTKDDECGGNNHCVEIGNVACSADNLRVGGFYDIWSNKSAQYKGNVGLCSPEYNTCTEIIDRQDTSNVNPEGKPYYVLFNNKIEEKKAQCTEVSLSDGCILFDKTDEPNKVYDSAATYLRSEKRADRPFGPVAPARSGDVDFRSADTNLLMKVNRDRSCSEWLACKSYASTVSYEGGVRRETQICAQLAACDSIGVGGSCGHWVDPKTVGSSEGLSRLTYDNYVSRPVSWYSTEMSGYSLYNKYQIGDMIYVKFNFPQDLQSLLAEEMNHTYIVRQLRQNIFDLLDSEQFDCKPEANEDTNWKACGFGDNQVNGGRCYENRCMYPIDGAFPSNLKADAPGLNATQKANIIKQLLAYLEPNSCKGVPEEDSPYSDKILKVGQGEQLLVNPSAPDAGQKRDTTFKLEGFSGANACQGGACSCAYQKIHYGDAGVQDYWPLFGLKSGVIIPDGLCSGGGNKDKYPCSTDIDCTDDKATPATEDDEFGRCNLRSNAETRIGLEGYCLEKDRSRPIFYNGQNSFACLTWLPVNISASAVDIYNTDVSAGYNLKDDAGPGSGQIYCEGSTATGAGNVDANAIDFGNGNVTPSDQNFESRFNLIFNPKGFPYFVFPLNLPGGTCNETEGLFKDHVCGSYGADGGGNGLPAFVKALYTDIYSLLWHSRINNSTILRLEWGAPKGTDDWGNDWDNDAERRIYSFAPRISGANEWGTIMHPPRSFAPMQGEDMSVRQSDIVRPIDNITDADELNFQIYSNAYGVNGEAGVRNGRLYRSDSEQYLYENDLSKVIFLALSYPGGGGAGEAVGLMQKEYAIDFDRLRQPGAVPADAILLWDADGHGTFNLHSKFDTVLWTYKLDNVSQSAFAYHDYSHFNQSQRLRTLAGDERNRIQTRYVAVWSDWIAKGENDETPNFLQQNVPTDGAEKPEILRDQVTPASPNSDPFSAPCTDQTSNWLAIGMDFNKNGQFLGYIARWCNVESDAFGIQFAVAAQLHDRCTTFDQVYDAEGINPLYGTTNKAWTNQVWFGAKHTDAISPRKIGGNPWGYFSIDGLQRPYSSLRLVESDLNNYNKLRNYTFRYKEQGLPYICSARWLGQKSVDGAKRCQALLLVPHDSIFVQQMNAQNSVAAASEKIRGLFAKIFSVTTLDDRTDGNGDMLIYDNGTGLSTDFYTDEAHTGEIDTSNSHAYPPKIFSLNPSRCEDRDKCSAAEKDNITIGSRNGTRADYNGDGVADEPDVDQNGVTDPIIAPGGNFTAEAKFFAFADDNHMPIRRVMVDWDEEGLPPMNADKRGLYKNRKPVCGTSNQGGLADVGMCATLYHDGNENNPPTFNSTGVTCSNDKICPNGSVCIPAVDVTFGSAKICMGNNRAGDQIYSGQLCNVDADCAGQGDANTCRPASEHLPAGSLQTGALGDWYKSMRFGNTPRACTTDYFTYVHQYSCGESNLGTHNAVLVRDLNTNNNPYFDSSFTQGLEEVLKNTYGLRDDDYVCVFKPRVQVEDNWEWCNGTCTTDYNGVNPRAGAATRGACYNNQTTTVANIFSRQCDKLESVEGINPWSRYKGTILVIPEIDRER